MILIKRHLLRLILVMGLCCFGLLLLSAKPVHAGYLGWSLATDSGDLDLTQPDDLAEETAADAAQTKGQPQAYKLDKRAQGLVVKPGKVPGNPKESAKKIVYLTFDDGPSENTQKILKILDHYHIKATFFVTDQEPQYDGMIKKAYDKGNTIGLHSSTHQYSIYRTEMTYFDDLNKIAKTVKREIGFVPAFVRFPGGSSNTVSRSYASGIMTKLAKDLNARGYQYYDWNADSTDGAMANGDPNVLVAHATACKDNNIILLCHDTAAKSHTVDALPRIIETYQKRGYTFRPITRDSFVAHHHINN